jgi:hypothetical protein
VFFSDGLTPFTAIVAAGGLGAGAGAGGGASAIYQGATPLRWPPVAGRVRAQNQRLRGGGSPGRREQGSRAAAVPAGIPANRAPHRAAGGHPDPAPGGRRGRRRTSHSAAEPGGAYSSATVGGAGGTAGLGPPSAYSGAGSGMGAVLPGAAGWGAGGGARDFSEQSGGGGGGGLYGGGAGGKSLAALVVSLRRRRRSSHLSIDPVAVAEAAFWAPAFSRPVQRGRWGSRAGRGRQGSAVIRARIAPWPVGS